IPKKAGLSDSQYQTVIASLTAEFQSRLAYLNPTNQGSYSATTDVSSGLCSVARILKHANSYVQAGDSAAFIIISDDNDRLNVRNPNGNQCLESVAAANQVVDGTCGHNVTDFSYSTSSNATVNYQTDSQFTYQSGTTFKYTFPATDT